MEERSCKATCTRKQWRGIKARGVGFLLHTFGATYSALPCVLRVQDRMLEQSSLPTHE